MKFSGTLGGRTSNNAVIPRQSPITGHSEPVTDVTGVRISRMKSTTYRFAPKTLPISIQYAGEHRSPVPFHGEIPTALKQTAVEMTPYRNGPLSHGVRRDCSPKGRAKGASRRALNSHFSLSAPMPPTFSVSFRNGANRTLARMTNSHHMPKRFPRKRISGTAAHQ